MKTQIRSPINRRKVSRKILVSVLCVTLLACLFAVGVFADGDTYDQGQTADNFGSFVTAMFTTFTEVMSGLAGGLKTAFLQLIYVDPSATTLKYSPLVMFLFVAGGIALAFGILYSVFGIVRRTAHR